MIHESQFPRLQTSPYLALRQSMDFFRTGSPAFRCQLDETLVTALDFRLNSTLENWSRGAIQMPGIRQLCGAHTITVNAQGFERLVKHRNQTKYADGTRDSAGRRPDLICGRCYPVTTGSGDSSKRSDHRNAGLLGQLYFTTDNFCRKSAAARTINAQHQCLHLSVFTDLLNLCCQ